MMFDPNPNAPCKNIADTKIRADPDDPNALTVYEGKLYVEGCDCMAAVQDVETARRMRDLIDAWLKADDRTAES